MTRKARGKHRKGAKTREAGARKAEASETGARKAEASETGARKAEASETGARKAEASETGARKAEARDRTEARERHNTSVLYIALHSCSVFEAMLPDAIIFFLCLSTRECDLATWPG
jgi:hypothetical protein